MMWSARTPRKPGLMAQTVKRARLSVFSSTCCASPSVAMETVAGTSSLPIAFAISNLSSTNRLESYSKSIVNLTSKKTINRPIKTTSTAIAASYDVSAAANPAEAEITWQIIVGTIAGITPFVVAGIEFSKRILAQRRCEVCRGSGLVLRDNKYYFRCPQCGGFLPWQSWKRFFSG